MQQRPHRNSIEVAIGRLLAERDAGEYRGAPIQLDLFASPDEARLFKRRRGRPPSARAKPKSRRW